MAIADEMERTIAEATARGIIDPELHAGPIACVRDLACRADLAGENDNVTFPTLLKYLGAMGVVDVPTRGRPKKQTDDQPKSKLDAARGTRYSRFKAV